MLPLQPPSLPLAVSLPLVEGGGHWATKTNINMGLWGAAGQDSWADPLIGVSDRSNNKPHSVLLRSGCPPGVNNQGALCSVSVNLCFTSSLFPFPLSYPPFSFVHQGSPGAAGPAGTRGPKGLRVSLKFHTCCFCSWGADWWITVCIIVPSLKSRSSRTWPTSADTHHFSVFVCAPRCVYRSHVLLLLLSHWKNQSGWT